MSLYRNILARLRSPSWVERLCILLVAANMLSLLAARHWFFDLFVNFKIQYLYGAVILFALSLLFRLRVYALCMAILACALFAQIATVYETPFAKAPEIAPNFTVVQFNKYFKNHRYDDKIGPWLRDPANARFDVVVVNESLWDAIAPLQEFKDLYPYQYPNDGTERFGDISIISKHPITIKRLPMAWRDRVFSVTRAEVRKPGLLPVTIFAYHAQVPMGEYSASRRDFELKTLAGFARNDEASGIIMMGDWNLTPWSPLFREVLNISGLRYQQYDLLPQATWPSFHYFDMLKIPIDQILFDNTLTLTGIRQGPSNASDHHSLIADFYATPAP